MNTITWDKVYQKILDKLTQDFMSINGFNDRTKAFTALFKAAQEVRELNEVYELESRK